MSTRTASYAAAVPAQRPASLALTSSERAIPPSTEEVVRWFVLQTRSNQEKAAAELVQSSGAECFLPLLRKVRYYGHRQRIIHTPLFTCYVFLKGFPYHAYQAISAKRAARLIPIPDQAQFQREIDQIRLALNAGADLGPYRFFTRGRRIRVTSGPFMGLEGVVEDRLGQNRLILKVHAIGRALSLEIDASLLEPLD